MNIFDKKGQSVGKRAVSVRPAIAGFLLEFLFMLVASMLLYGPTLNE